MKIEYLREFAAVGKYLNFSKAAEELFISQSNLSRHVAYMEEELDQKLLKRDTHNVELTEAGEAVLNSCRIIIKQYDGMLDQLQSMSTGAYGKIRLAQSHFAAERYVNPILYEFLKQYPMVSTNVLSCEPHDVKKAVLDGEAELGLFVYYGEPLDTDLVYHEIAKEKCLFCLPESHPLAGRKGLKLSDINGENLILVAQDASYLAYLDNVFAEHRIYPKKRIYLESISNLTTIFQLQNAIALEPEHISEHPHRGLVYLPVLDTDIFARIGYIHLPEIKSPTVKLFLNTVRSFDFSR